VLYDNRPIRGYYSGRARDRLTRAELFKPGLFVHEEKNMRISVTSRLCGIFVLGLVASAHAQLEITSSKDDCGQIESLRKAGDLGGARDKAVACVEQLNQELAGSAANSFPTTVAGWKRGNIEQNQALGVNNVSTTYVKDKHTVTVSLTGGNKGTGSVGGLLGGIAKFGIKSSGKQIKVAGLPGSVQADGSVAVTLEDGSFLGFVCPDFRTADDALAGFGDLINAFPVAEINKRLK
jgi:hypothetical protein